LPSASVPTTCDFFECAIGESAARRGAERSGDGSQTAGRHRAAAAQRRRLGPAPSDPRGAARSDGTRGAFGGRTTASPRRAPDPSRFDPRLAMTPVFLLCASVLPRSDLHFCPLSRFHSKCQTILPVAYSFHKLRNPEKFAFCFSDI